MLWDEIRKYREPLIVIHNCEFPCHSGFVGQPWNLLKFLCVQFSRFRKWSLCSQCSLLILEAHHCTFIPSVTQASVFCCTLTPHQTAWKSSEDSTVIVDKRSLNLSELLLRQGSRLRFYFEVQKELYLKFPKLGNTYRWFNDELSATQSVN